MVCLSRAEASHIFPLPDTKRARERTYRKLYNPPRIVAIARALDRSDLGRGHWAHELSLSVYMLRAYSTTDRVQSEADTEEDVFGNSKAELNLNDPLFIQFTDDAREFLISSIRLQRRSGMHPSWISRPRINNERKLHSKRTIFRPLLSQSEWADSTPCSVWLFHRSNHAKGTAGLRTSRSSPGSQQTKELALPFVERLSH